MKKYIQISELSKLLSISQTKLRYLESSGKIKIKQIRGRRYYSEADIVKIKKLILHPISKDETVQHGAVGIHRPLHTTHPRNDHTNVRNLDGTNAQLDLFSYHARKQQPIFSKILSFKAKLEYHKSKLLELIECV